MADPEPAADVSERDGYHLVVELGHRRRDKDTAEAKQGLDIHGSTNSILNKLPWLPSWRTVGILGRHPRSGISSQTYGTNKGQDGKPKALGSSSRTTSCNLDRSR